MKNFQFYFKIKLYIIFFKEIKIALQLIIINYLRISSLRSTLKCPGQIELILAKLILGYSIQIAMGKRNVIRPV